MILGRILRFVGALFLWALGLVVLSLPAMAAGPRHAMSPLLRLDAQEALANVQAGAAGPQYGLFGCQV